jgi:hypothetical protein
MVLDSFDFVRRTLAVLASLIDDRGHQQFSWVKLADREALKPGLLAASETLKLCSPVVPQLDVDAVGAALAEEDDRHKGSLLIR